MKLLVVGLGNPGKKYDGTRHNVGFMAADGLAKSFGLKFTKAQKTESQLAQSSEIIIAKPLTFMNNSGRAVKALVHYFDIPLTDVVIVYDDVDLALGTFKVKSMGTSAGHNGMQSILEVFKTNQIPRIRIGVGRDAHIDTSDYVLSKFKRQEQTIISEVVEQVVAAVQEKLIS